MTATTVMLVDDHLVVRAGLRALLDSQPDIEVIGEADSGEQGVDMAAALAPRLVMMDLALGAGIDGVEAIRRIRAACPTLPVLVFTTYDTDADVVRAIDAGAIGYLLKDSAPQEIFAAIRGAVAGQSVLSPPVASRLLQQMRRPDEALTAREAELLTLLAEGLYQQGTRQTAVHQRGHRQDAPRAHLRQARGGHQGGGGLGRVAPRRDSLTARCRWPGLPSCSHPTEGRR